MLYHSSLFTLTQSFLNFVANLALSRLRAFWGHFWPKFGGGGHKNILVDREPHSHIGHRSSKSTSGANKIHLWTNLLFYSWGGISCFFLLNCRKFPVALRGRPVVWLPGQKLPNVAPIKSGKRVPPIKLPLRDKSNWNPTPLLYFTHRQSLPSSKHHIAITIFWGASKECWRWICMFVSFRGADNVLKLRKGVKRDAPPCHSFAPSPWRKCYKKDGDNINGKRDD